MTQHIYSDNRLEWKISDTETELVLCFKDDYFHEIFRSIPIKKAIRWRCVFLDEFISKLTVVWFTKKLDKNSNYFNDNFKNISEQLLRYTI